VNRLLLVGFYLVNVGLVLLSASIGGDARTGSDLLQQLSVKVGILMLILGLVHLLNVRMLSRFRNRRMDKLTDDVPPAGPLTGTKQATPSGY
jgi:cytochrome c biogenesis protein CcdA